MGNKLDPNDIAFTMNTSSTGDSTCAYKPQINECSHRLPCGLCTYLRSMCPLQNRTTITWSENPSQTICEV